MELLDVTGGALVVSVTLLVGGSLTLLLVVALVLVLGSVCFEVGDVVDSLGSLFFVVSEDVSSGVKSKRLV